MALCFEEFIFKISCPKQHAVLCDANVTEPFIPSCPQPKIEWLKNQMIIGDDPKFRQITNQGVCSLEIRKPCCFDGGIYTCRARNAHGEATVACKLEVKRESEQSGCRVGPCPFLNLPPQG